MLCCAALVTAQLSMTACAPVHNGCALAAGVYRQEAFMQWLSQTLLASLYPGAPYERKYLAMLLLNSLLEVWNAPHAGSKSYTKPISAEDNALISNAGTLVIGKYQFQAFCEGFFDAQTTQVLLGMGPTATLRCTQYAGI